MFFTILQVFRDHKRLLLLEIYPVWYSVEEAFGLKR